MASDEKNQSNLINYELNISFNKYIFADKPINRFKTKLKVEDISSKLDDLRSEIKKIENCELKKNASKIVFSDGNNKSKIMIVGEGPGQKEDQEGKPFVGDAGMLLNKMLKSINIERKNVYITNVVPWRPPNNRTPNNEEIMACLPFIQKHIEIINPKLILLLGTTAAKTILNSNLSITKLRGNWHEYKSYNQEEVSYCLVTYHPAFLLRAPDNKKLSWEDLKLFKKRILNKNL